MQSCARTMANLLDRKSKPTLHNDDSNHSPRIYAPEKSLPTIADAAAAEQSSKTHAQDPAPALTFIAFAYTYLFWYTTRSGSSCAQLSLLWLAERAWVLSLPFSSSLIAMDLVYDALLSHHEHRSPPIPAVPRCRLAKRKRWRKIISVWIGGLKLAILLTCLIGPDRLFPTCR